MKISEKEQNLSKTQQENNVEGPSEAPESLERKDKTVIYIQHCWPSLLLGAASTALEIGAQKISLDRLAGAYLVSQFFEDKSEKQQKLIDKLKEKAGIKEDSKADRELKNEIVDEEHPKDNILEEIKPYAGSGKTLFIDEVTGNRWFGDIVEVTDGIADFNNALIKKRGDALKKHYKSDPFFYSENPFSDKEFNPRTNCSDVYSALDVGYFLECIGESKSANNKMPRISELLEFRYYGGELDPVIAKDILNYKEYTDRISGFPVVCYIDYADILSKSSELDERCPF
jgi:hypothetical protein